MELFKDYMNKVKAENGLKENTKNFILAELAGSPERNSPSARPNKNFGRYTMKKMFAIAAAAVICVGLATGAFAYYNTPVNYISVDINPSVELGVNGIGRVIKAEGINGDGLKLIEKTNLKNLSVKEAVSNLVKSASENGYIAADGSTVVSVTAESKNKNSAESIQKESEEGVNDALKAKNILAVVYANSSDLEMRTQAKELGISPGKFKVVQIMQALDPTLKAEDYKDAKMKDIIIKADELLKAYKNGTLTTDQQIAFKGVSTAAEKVKNANGKKNQGEETQVKAQNENKGEKTPEQEKEKNQNNGNSKNDVSQKGSENSNGKGNGKSSETEVSPTPAPEQNTDSGSAASSGNSSQAKGNGKGANKS